jgi:hypothetical protein
MDEQDRELRRRDFIRKAVVGSGIVWATPVIQSVTNAAYAAGTPRPTTTSTSATIPLCECDLEQPCNIAIPCNGSEGCNCWVLADRSGCFCGPIPLCETLTPCGPGGTCPDGEVCVENCCGKYCYPPCGPAAQAAPSSAVIANPAAYGLRG